MASIAGILLAPSIVGSLVGGLSGFGAGVSYVFDDADEPMGYLGVAKAAVILSGSTMIGAVGGFVAIPAYVVINGVNYVRTLIPIPDKKDPIEMNQSPCATVITVEAIKLVWLKNSKPLKSISRFAPITVRSYLGNFGIQRHGVFSYRVVALDTAKEMFMPLTYAVDYNTALRVLQEFSNLEHRSTTKLKIYGTFSRKELNDIIMKIN